MDFGVISTLIARELGFPAGYIDLLTRTASHRYYSFGIPKKKGGVREIHHPSKELKLLQRWLVKRVFGRLPIHESAYAYREGRNIAQHAQIHSRHNFLLKLDFTDFFPSIRGADVVNVLRKHADTLGDVVAEESDYEAISQLVCRRGSLTIGAPSSPVISNVVMFDLDKRWATRSQAEGIAYSRYADDLCFSTDQRNVLGDLVKELRTDIARCESPKLLLNEEKCVFTSRKRLRSVTGLVLTSTKQVSIGRARKRRVKSLVYRFSRNLLSEQDKTSLRGLISYVRSVEPSFISSLTRKYGVAVIESIGRKA